MEKTKPIAVSGLLVGTWLLSRSIPTTFTFDKPIHTSIIFLAACGATVIGLSRLLPNNAKSHGGQQYDAVPLEDIGQPHKSRDSSPSPQGVGYPSSLRKLRIVFITLVAAICLRVEIWRRILNNTECATRTWVTWIPLVLAVWDYWTVQRHKKRWESDDPETSAYEALEQSLTRAPYRYLLATALLSLGSVWALSTTSPPRSTYICAASLYFTWLMPLLQHVGTVLDLIILYCIDQLLHQQEGRGARSIRLQISSVGFAFVFSATILLTSGIVYFTVTEDDRIWITKLPRIYIWGIIELGALGCFTAVCALLTIYHVGLLTTTTLITFVAVTATVTSFAWRNPHPFPTINTSASLVAACLLILGIALYLHVNSTTEERYSGPRGALCRKVPLVVYLALLVLFLIRTAFWVSRGTHVSYHPIDLLIYEAQAAHEDYRNRAASSLNLEEAVQSYKVKYGRDPPPKFDVWYSYATARNSVVIDEFDSIYRDMLPFYALSPQEIRERTFTMISNPWNDVAGISIRSGKVDISPNVVPTHRWMLDGVVEMITKFVEHIPDMDLAFNLNDEPRVTVPYERIEPMRQAAVAVAPPDAQVKNAFSPNRAEGWQPIPEEVRDGEDLSPLKAASFQRTFYDFGNVGCPPNSRARKERVWNKRNICWRCAAPHSLGAFLANWTLAADICHQPDLADLHGLYLSPAAYKGTHDLYPIFSQSKAHGFNDILYPSAWNYMDKAKYDPTDEHPDPPYAEKNKTLFWRGATSEGVSPGLGQWRGMARQRFIHNANNINASEPASSLLLPSGPNHLKYISIPIQSLTTLLQTDVHIVDFIARCGGPDCETQATEFSPLLPASDFQHHWTHKYLLDLDGAGFSGRFLPFLQSNSLPYKSALFREWWDDRVTAWWHFVPLDVRGQGFWGTLAYFSGVNGTVGARSVVMEGKGVEGERIAERGRVWAEKALRKVDMEVYFFRLLLEWGRVTDDGREGIGLTV
ncbi:hypothetical protein EJ03DRAFT_267334 [Teratosphaeria nubilosa]|uniref:Glycosyl transferase CAP10 domain-containing protein n=1 Tax=Teratosphaeria nubilosa TaxID=161662 RepID=A0A6G1LI73_9PEZI|nr:hypothetical protein EJ03DRAFT_267334 [Teratosphaeria nubilosa]